MVRRILRDPSTGPGRVARAAFRRAVWMATRAVDSWHSAYHAPIAASPARLVRQAPGGFTTEDVQALNGVVREYLRHRVDVLGSGWRSVNRIDHPEAAAGPNAPRSKALRALIAQPYTPIAWNSDVKSGFAWPPGAWYLTVNVRPRHGVDVKVPWEIARMNHLLQLAVAHSVPGVLEEGDRRTAAREFRNQVLDFLAANPPRFGVNWRSTMDVAIRVANILVAHDLFRAAGAEFDAEFESAVTTSAHEHALHIVGNFERFSSGRGNHYLAHVVGLAFAAAYLPPNDVTNAWLVIARAELISEILLQFGLDGGNVEGSTSYHRLSLEIALTGTALLSAVPSDRFRLGSPPPGTFPRGIRRRDLVEGDPADSALAARAYARLARASRFALDCRKPDGAVAQIGDNDSGRLFKIAPRYSRMSAAAAVAMYANLAGWQASDPTETYWDEVILDNREVIDAAAALLGNECVAADWYTSVPTRSFPTMLGVRAQRAQLQKSVAVSGIAAPAGTRLDGWTHLVEAEGDLTAGITLAAYPEFGVFIYRSQRLFLLIRCGFAYWREHAGHSHNDQLAVELWIDGRDVFRDPGTFTYTADPEQRNAYRSAKAHTGICWSEREPRTLDVSLFAMPGPITSRCVSVEARRFRCLHSDFEHDVLRDIEIRPNAIVVNDSIIARNHTSRLHGRYWTPLARPPLVRFSPGYGKVLRA